MSNASDHPELIVPSGMPMGVNGLGPPGPTPSIHTGGLSPRDIIQVIRKRIWLILISVVFFTTVAGVVTYLWAKYDPYYTAYAQLEVQSPTRSLQSFSGPNWGITPDMPQLLATHAALIGSTDTMQEVAENETVRKTTWAQKAPLDQLTERLREAIGVNPQAKSRLIYVSATTNKPVEAAVIANAVCEVYERLSRTRSQSLQVDYINSLNDQISDLKKELENIRLEMESLATGSEVADLTEVGSTKREELEQLSTQMVRLRYEHSRASLAYQRLVEANEQGRLLEMPEIKAALYSDPSYSALLQQQAQHQNQFDYYQRRYGPKHSTVLETQAALESTNAEVAAAQEVGVQAFLDRRRGEVEGLAAQLGELAERIRLTEGQVRDLRKTLVRLKAHQLREQDRANIISRLELSLRSQQFELQLLVPVRLSGRASPPTTRSQPNSPFMVAGGVVLGLAVGVGLTVLLELIDTSIKRPSDVLRRIDLPLLGMVPHTDDVEEEIEEVRLALAQFPDSPVGEAFRQIRTRVVFSGPAEHSRTLLITSPSPEDGRTTIATNLGTAMADGGSKVLLVDANFRQPMMHQLYEMGDEAGLSNVLIGQAGWTDITHEVSDRLHVIAAGPLPTNPAELLAGPEMRAFLAEAPQRYDRILIETGPVTVVTDALVLASMVDGIVMVFRAGSNSYGVANRAKNMLVEARGHLLGAVLNGVRVMAGGYLRKNYDAFYEYRERQALPA